MTINQKLTNAEVKSATLFLIIQSKLIKRFKIRHLYLLVVVLGLAIFALSNAPTDIGYDPVKESLIIPIVFAIIFSIIASVYYKVAKLKQRIISYNIDDSGITATTVDDSLEKVAWFDFKNWKEFKGLIFLYYTENEHNVFIISNSAFKSEEEKIEFISMLADNKINRL